LSFRWRIIQFVLLFVLLDFFVSRLTAFVLFFFVCFPLNCSCSRRSWLLSYNKQRSCFLGSTWLTNHNSWWYWSTRWIHSNTVRRKEVFCAGVTIIRDAPSWTAVPVRFSQPEKKCQTATRSRSASSTPSKGIYNVRCSNAGWIHTRCNACCQPAEGADGCATTFGTSVVVVRKTTQQTQAVTRNTSFAYRWHFLMVSWNEDFYRFYTQFNTGKGSCIRFARFWHYLIHKCTWVPGLLLSFS